MVQTSRGMTKSPVSLARHALKAAQKVLGDHASPYSKKKFTQPQLFAILVLKAFFRTDYRGIIEILRDFSDLRNTLGLTSVPHYSTLAYAEKRLLKKRLLTYSNSLSSDPLDDTAFFEIKIVP